MIETNDDLVAKILSVERDFHVPPKAALTWQHLTSIDVSPKPRRQRCVTYPTLGLNFWFLPGLNICIKGLDKLAQDQPYIFAMNHSDSFNFLPILYKFLRQRRNTTVWIKGKNYRRWVGRTFFDAMGLIPLPPANYVLQRLYQCRFSNFPDHKTLTKTEYRLVKDVFDGNVSIDDALRQTRQAEVQYMIIRADELAFYHDQLMQRVGWLTLEALQEHGLSLLIFPEGTRSVRLGEAHIGIAQVALYTGIPVVPISCNGGHEIYQNNNNPFARKGTITYVIGDPLTVDGALNSYAVSDSSPFLSRASKQAHYDAFEGATRLIMQRIHDRLDEPHRNVRLYS